MMNTHTKDNTTRTAIAYVRVSTEEQALGMEVQRQRVAAYCTARGWDLVAVVEDAGASGKNLERDGMRKVRDVMRRRAVDAVVVMKLDRLTRSTRDLHTLMQESDKYGVALVSITETLDTGSAAGRLMVHMLAAMAEWERETIAERTSAALQVMAARGERVGGHLALGQGGHGASELDAMQVLRQIVLADVCGCDGNSLRCLARELEDAGYLNRAGKRYTQGSVQRLLAALARKDAEVAEHLHMIKDARRRERQAAKRDEVLAIIAGKVAA